MDNIKLLKNYILYFLLMILVCLIGITNVMAWTNSNGVTYNAIGYITSDTDLYIDVTYDTQSQTRLGISTNQTVYTEIKTLYLELGYSFYGNVRYQVELSLGGLQLSYANIYTVYDNQNNKACLISLSDSIMNNDSYPRWDFQCEDNTQDITITIFNSNSGKITEYGYFSWTYSHLYNSTDLITGTDNNNDIIINNNENTDRIINNQNENTDKIIESQQVCNYIDKNYILLDNKVLNSSGEIVERNNWGLTDYIKIDNSTIKVLEKASSNVTYLCFYNINKSKISCMSNNSLTINDYITIPDHSSYVRFSITKEVNQPQLDICTNGNRAISDSINDLNDSINDDDIDAATSEASDFFSDFNTNTFGLTSIITAPLNLIESLSSSSCTSLHLPLPYLDNKYLDLPCMSNIYYQYFGTFFTLYQTITYGIIAYWVCVRIFNLVKDFKNPEHDEIQVVDL